MRQAKEPRGPEFSVLLADEGGAETAAERIYGGALRFATRPAPRVVANFVSSIDGVVSLNLLDGTDSSTVSGHHAGDRYVMGMLRAAADAVMIGAGTLRASVGHQWTPRMISPEHADIYAAYRDALGRPSSPAPLVIVSGSGHLPSHVALTEPATEVIVATSLKGAELCRAAFPKLRVITVGGDRRTRGADLLTAVRRELGSTLILTEGGPSLIGTLLGSDSVHELFLTIAPWLAGRDPAHPRLGLVNNFVAPPHALRAGVLQSARRSGDHLFLRYRFDS